VDEEHIEGEAGDTGLDDDFPGFEPVQPQAPVEHELEGTDRDDQPKETGPVQMLSAPLPRFANEDTPPGPGQKPNGSDQVECPTPVDCLSDIAAEDRTDDGAHYGDEAPKTNHQGMLSPWEDIQEDGLDQREQRGATETLNNPPQHEFRKAFRRAAEDSCGDKPGDARSYEAAATDPSRDSGGQRRRNCNRDDLESDHPGDLVLSS